MTNIEDILLEGIHAYRGGGDKLLFSIDDTQYQLQKAFEEAVEEIIGENYRPSELENDTRWVKQIPPSTAHYISKSEAQAANEEMATQRTKAKQVIKEMFR